MMASHQPRDLPPVSRRDMVCLDALSFFVADVQTGFGPFITVSLATSGWSEGQIGQALSVGTIVALVSQLPGGAIVDRLADKRSAVGVSCVIVAAAAVLFALSASTASVMTAEVFHSFGSAMLGPAIAAVSLAVVGWVGLGERLGRNARFAAIGNGFAAALLGVVGWSLPPGSVFWLTAGFMLPGLAILPLMGSSRRHEPAPRAGPVRRGPLSDIAALITDRRVLGFAGCVALFHLANAALLPIAAADLTHRIGQQANLVLAAAVVVPQAIVALIAPTVGTMADRRGPRLILVLGFAAVPLRALLLAVVSDPSLTIAVQALDGLSAATFGIMVPLVAAELTRGTARFNLCLGMFGLATAAGATVSTSLAGAIADHAGNPTAFVALAACGLLAVAAVGFAAPRGGR